MSEIMFNGPPPPKKNAGPPLAEFRAALDARIGEWGCREYASIIQARNAAAYLRRNGYETAVRGKIAYARRLG